MEKRTINIPHH
jgi:hypothetical protein